mmetsp:Transcript_44761/g.100500  ORF Transcript_44761/g.100500 Transcript_44761/m.100500 type:complete len:656 (-) Transcript_44761:62-2029(-)|eukprot:CAMPEP_0197881308 /NCGR_PEP_ID=MMETSP1439-20131203/8828_1 /TAXON_ID=66791 /ORGANISM="Gonyaulax spinifera, Strain CCMP409" /LENGTH=655 /DNA_ID=CAMNT_0043500907 /DNA_START=59 /DNA_END=2026 /DNA_ORIENTATION=-
MALVASNPEPVHTGVFLPPRAHNSDSFFEDYSKKIREPYTPPQHVKEFYEKHQGQTSYTDRTVNIYLEGTTESLAIGAKVSTTVKEVQDVLGMFLQRDPNTISIKRKTATGHTLQRIQDEVASTIYISASGLKSFKRQPQQYEHPFLVVGAGLGGIQAMIDFHIKGRTDIVCMDRNEDFGGHSWIKVPNKFTKLQTERGTYHVEYCIPDAHVPKKVCDVNYSTWPSRDMLLAMMREGSKAHGLYDHTMFNTHIEKVIPKKGSYAIQYMPVNEDDGDADIMMTANVVCYPGFLHDANRVEFAGEDEFGGYIEYSSFDKVDYELTVGKTVVMYGHGAFTIENVRTLCEHRIKKVYVVCRTRNLSGTKIASWLIGSVQRPLPAIVMMDAFKRMYDLLGWDVWQAYSVKSDAERTNVQIEQKTIFGVTDIYFLAGYFGLMEVIVDEIKRLTHQCVHTKNGSKLGCEVLIKAIGTAPSFKVDKEMGIKEVRGFYVNGDPLRPIMLGAKGVQAKNFGSFSVGPGLAPSIKMLHWFLEYPEDWNLVKDTLPVNKAGVFPAFVTNASYGLPVSLILQTTIPGLAQEVNEANDIKHRKQAEAHPMEEYLAQCKAEWESYIAYFRKHDMVDDRPDPAYPYTEEVIWGFMEKADAIQRGEKRSADF